MKDSAAETASTLIQCMKALTDSLQTNTELAAVCQTGALR
nr:MAG TPA: hypothetical protein [Caudoviricetes sp.]DAY53731.1 MAG TPA: hypothetical protein [Caudoviricetes sp.]DAY55973.1 MAG TPA: hypothetical protein [Caudoviricetes sp.]